MTRTNQATRAIGGASGRLTLTARAAAALLFSSGVALGISGNRAATDNPAGTLSPPKSDRRVVVNTDEGVAVVEVTDVLGPGTSSSNSAYYQFSENGRRVEVNLRDSMVTSARVNDEAIPSDRIKFENGTITLLNADGSTLWTHDLGAESMAASPSGAFGSGPSSPRYSTLIVDPDMAAKAHARWQIKSAAPALPPPKVMIGVQMSDVPDVLRGHLGLEKDCGVLVSTVYKDLPAYAAGLRPYDVIIGMNGTGGMQNNVTDDQVRTRLRELGAGDTLDLLVIQQGQRKTISITTQAYDADKLAAARGESIEAVQGMLLGGTSGRGATIYSAPGTDPGGLAILGSPGQSWNWSGSDPALAADIQRRTEEALARAFAAHGMAGAGQAHLDESAARMREHMERMEKMLQELMRKQGAGEPTPAAPDEPDPASRPTPKSGESNS